MTCVFIILNMYSTLILVLVALTLVSAEHKEECKRLMGPHTMQCCKKPATSPDNFADNMKDIGDCFKFQPDPPKPHNCDVDICIAKKKGFGTDDGKFDQQKVEDYAEKEFDAELEVLSGIKEQCLSKDLSKFGHPDDCDVMKLRHCIGKQLIENCPEWDDHGPCSGMKDLVTTCESYAP